MKSLSFFLFFAVSVGMVLPARGALIEAGPADDVESIINALAPGDELVLADGQYTITERFSFALVATEQTPILIRAADGASVHFHRPDANQNIWDFSGTWVTIRGLRFSGGSAGLRVEGADHLTIEDCEIDTTADVALRMNDAGVTYRNVRILRNHIHDTGGTGEGMYLGCNDDGCRLENGLIEGNYVHNTDGPSVSQGDGIELKEGSSGNVIRDNVIHDTNYPCILTYSAAGNGAANLIERNVLWNCGDHGIQSAQDSIIRNNIILGAVGDGISLQPHQSGIPGNQIVSHNTVFNAGGSAIVVRQAAGSVVVANNAVYAEGASAIRIVGSDATVIVSGNVGVGGLEGTTQDGLATGDLTADLVDAHLDGAPPIDCYPTADGALPGAADPAYLAADDFNGTDRTGSADAGAYRFDAGGNPGWTIIPDFKDATPVVVGACGDNVLDDGEECDDGNTTDGDGCSASCLIETSASCGDNVLDDGEECDDGNTTDGDGCSATCRIETSASCGDNVLDEGEACDDGNTIDGDGCSATCALEKKEADSGCGCSTPGNRKSTPWPWMLASLAALLLYRRRR